VIQPKDKRERGDRIDIAPGQPLEHARILRRLIEILLDAGQIGGIERLHADEDPLPARRRDQVQQILIPQQVGTCSGSQTCL
jgi:hypothetical protein